MNALGALHRAAALAAPPTSPAPAFPPVSDGYSLYAPSSPPYSSIWDDES